MDGLTISAAQYCVSFANITCNTAQSFQKKQAFHHRTVKAEGGLILIVKDIRRYVGHPLEILNLYIYFQHFIHVYFYTLPFL